MVVLDGKCQGIAFSARLTKFQFGMVFHLDITLPGGSGLPSTIGHEDLAV